MAKTPSLLRSLYTLLLFVALQGVTGIMISKNDAFQQSALMRGIHQVQAKNWARRDMVRAYFHLEETNQRLAEENTLLQAQLALLQAEREAYRAMELPTPALSDTFSFLPAMVINNGVGRQQNFITLNKGSLDGVVPYSGVICSNGLVGIVKHVSPHFSTVVSLLNTQQRFTAIHLPTETFGTLQWDGNSYTSVILSEIPQHTHVSLGDTIVSSDFSDIFPPRIPIGVVARSEVKQGTFLELTVSLFADFKTLRYVHVVNKVLSDELHQLREQE